MVKRFLTSAVSLWLLLMMTAPAAWANALTVEPDRTQLYEGEILTLTVKGAMKIDINLTNLFSFDLSQLPSPNIEEVEPEFEILARNQRYSVQTVNNEMVGEITWTYQLAPTRSGTLTIPELTFQDSTSSPVTVEVLDGSPPNQPAPSRDSFIELSADKAEVYVQEQLILTIQLYFSGNLIRGELSEPEHPDAIIESLGKQREFARYRNGTRYRVVERRYAIFPQQPGELSLAPISFEGQARDASGQLRFLRDRQQLFDVQVKPVPDQYPAGQPWLPAASMTLSEEGLPSTGELSAGTNLNRKLTLQALGLPSEALPTLPQTVPDAIRSYPEQPLRNTETTADGLRSTLQQISALVPVQAGDAVLPAIRIPWWNTESDELEYAELPERRYKIDGGRAIVTPPIEDVTPPAGDQTPDIAVENPATDESSFWFVSTIVMTGLWLMTAAFWWFSRRQRDAQPQAGNTDDASETQAFTRLKDAIQAGSGQSSALLVSWARLRYPEQQLVTLEDVFEICGDSALADAMRRFQEGLFSNHRSSVGDDAIKRLINALERLRATRTAARSASAGLAPLYPASLSD
ncbi:MAG: Oxygen tolerance [Marinobacter excellens HL-55]|uniref:Oxygen tolerance n=1 Tax=Marinobacter excellens HL-55 TaxID=1305731 RepID=A0A0P7ZBW5_9GAMM|nr:MAG: Oxygen tolerance [Marinobacter excellens HL-55]